MNRYRNFKGALFDPTGLGFGGHDSQGRAWRQRHLAGVSYNAAEGRLIAFNADGLAMPLEHNRYALPSLFRMAVKYKHGVAHGKGCFGLADQSYQFLLGPDGLKKWATYWFAEPENGFANDKQALARETKKEIEELTENWSIERIARDPWHKEIIAGLTSRQEQQRAVNNWLAPEIQRIIEHNNAEYRKQIKIECEIEAWLKSSTGQLKHSPAVYR